MQIAGVAISHSFAVTGPTKGNASVFAWSNSRRAASPAGMADQYSSAADFEGVAHGAISSTWIPSMPESSKLKS
jgi:hypothetical protein